MNRVMVVGACGLLALGVHFKAEGRCATQTMGQRCVVAVNGVGRKGACFLLGVLIVVRVLHRLMYLKVSLVRFAHLRIIWNREGRGSQRKKIDSEGS